MAQRDQALIGILERIAGEITRQDDLQEEIIRRHDELSKAVESAGLHLRGTQIDTERTYDKVLAAITQYRSDMLNLVNEQDHINRNIEELRNSLKTTTYTLDVTKQKLLSLDERLALHEKTSSDFYEHAIKQPGIYKDALDDTTRNFTRLHADTEKHLAELHKETARQLDKFQHETLQRLLLLDGIVTSLQTLLTRTTPRRKNLIVRTAIRLRGFLRRKLHILFKPNNLNCLK